MSQSHSESPKSESQGVAADRVTVSRRGRVSTVSQSHSESPKSESQGVAADRVTVSRRGRVSTVSQVGW